MKRRNSFKCANKLGLHLLVMECIDPLGHRISVPEDSNACHQHNTAHFRTDNSQSRHRKVCNKSFHLGKRTRDQHISLSTQAQDGSESWDRQRLGHLDSWTRTASCQGRISSRMDSNKSHQQRNKQHPCKGNSLALQHWSCSRSGRVCKAEAWGSWPNLAKWVWLPWAVLSLPFLCHPVISSLISDYDFDW